MESEGRERGEGGIKWEGKSEGRGMGDKLAGEDSEGRVKKGERNGK